MKPEDIAQKIFEAVNASYMIFNKGAKHGINHNTELCLKNMVAEAIRAERSSPPSEGCADFTQPERQDFELKVGRLEAVINTLNKSIESLQNDLGTEQSMHAAWRKRAEEAEAELIAITKRPSEEPEEREKLAEEVFNIVRTIGLKNAPEIIPGDIATWETCKGSVREQARAVVDYVLSKASPPVCPGCRQNVAFCSDCRAKIRMDALEEAAKIVEKDAACSCYPMNKNNPSIHPEECCLFNTSAKIRALAKVEKEIRK